MIYFTTLFKKISKEDNNFIYMKTKLCALCQMEATTLYRVQVNKGKDWIFVCTDCCNKVKKEPNYRYGGTWKGERH